MVRRLLFAATFFAAAAAAGEYSMVLGGTCGCGTGGAGIQTYSTATSAYCPTGSYPTCDIASLTESDCVISCNGGPRVDLAYRNNSAIWVYTSSITCNNGVLTNGNGQSLFNLQRPTCAVKKRCDECAAIAHQPNCPTGMSCTPTNLVRSVAADGCSRLACAEGTLKFYDAAGAPIVNTANQLYCTTAKTWTNYSLDGSIVGGTAMPEPFTANCVLPNACAQCTPPTLATALTQLPAPFQAGFTIAPVNLTVDYGSCSVAKCPAGYILYGFSGSATNVTGLDYTFRRQLKCDSTSHWTNGGMAYTPSNLLLACLQTPCGPFEELPVDTRALRCENGQMKVDCGAKQIQVILPFPQSSVFVPTLVHIPTVQWMSFACDGSARFFGKFIQGRPMEVVCVDPPTTQAPTTTTPAAPAACPALTICTEAAVKDRWPLSTAYAVPTITDRVVCGGAATSIALGGNDGTPVITDEIVCLNGVWHQSFVIFPLAPIRDLVGRDTTCVACFD